MKRSSITALLACAGAVLPMACGSDPSPSPKLGQAPTSPQGQGNASAGAGGSIRVDDRIAEACGLPTARFAFNSSAVIIGDASALNTLATCFATGALKGKAMRLVGHADPRGETAYNFGLGQERAGSVAEYLKARGVGQTQLNTGSKGELEATGVDEDGWRRDRRVDILLVE